MNIEWYNRTEILIGKENMEKLKNSSIIVFGVGGVGGNCIEALVRAGIGRITIVDNDKVSITNLNRQLIALRSTINRSKVDVMAERIKDINPDCSTQAINGFLLPDNINDYNLNEYSYVVDCIDTVSSKIALAVYCEKYNIPLISAMGAGNKLDNTDFKVADIYKTINCPLAKVMRRELKNRGVKHLKCVYSPELPIKPQETDEETNKRMTPGSISYVPSVCGLIMAGEIIRDILK